MHLLVCSQLQSPSKSPRKKRGGGVTSESGDDATSSPRKGAGSPTKYGTWRELQKMSKANMKQKPPEEDHLKQDVDDVVRALDMLEDK